MLSPAFGTVDFELHAAAGRGGTQSMLRAVEPEGELTIDGAVYSVGDLRSTSTFRAYRNRTGFGASLVGLELQPGSCALGLVGLLSW